MKRSIPLLLCLILLVSSLVIPGRALSIGYGDFYDLESFESYLETENMPAGFIHPSRFFALGEFCHAGFRSPYRGNYRYGFLYAKNSYVYVEITHMSPTVPPVFIDAIPDNLGDMLVMPAHPERKDFSYYRNGFYYTYNGYDGMLEHIDWSANGIYFLLDIPYQYILKRNNPLIERLISTSEETATAAFMELCNSANLKPDLSPYWEAIIIGQIIPQFILVIIFVLMILFAIWKNRRRKLRKALNNIDSSVHDAPVLSENAVIQIQSYAYHTERFPRLHVSDIRPIHFSEKRSLTDLKRKTPK